MASKDHKHTWASTAGGYVCTDCTAAVSQTDVAASVTANAPFEFVLKKAWKDKGDGHGN